jgi:FixJ family two-component response regulator
MTVAIVDDDPGVRKSISRILNIVGCAPLLFESAEEFLKDGEAHRANCIILDVNLSGMSGLELRHRIDRTQLERPVIFITALSDHDTQMQALNAGCIAYLRKPFEADALISALESVAALVASSKRSGRISSGW